MIIMLNHYRTIAEVRANLAAFASGHDLMSHVEAIRWLESQV